VELIVDNVLLEPQTGLTLRKGLKQNLIGDGERYFPFAQVDEDGRLHGFGRYISREGDMVEGNYCYGALNGWCRTIHSDGFYTISWFEDGRDMGYCKMMDSKQTS